MVAQSFIEKCYKDLGLFWGSLITTAKQRGLKQQKVSLQKIQESIGKTAKSFSTLEKEIIHIKDQLIHLLPGWKKEGISLFDLSAFLRFFEDTISEYEKIRSTIDNCKTIDDFFLLAKSMRAKNFTLVAKKIDGLVNTPSFYRYGF